MNERTVHVEETSFALLSKHGYLHANLRAWVTEELSVLYTPRRISTARG